MTLWLLDSVDDEAVREAVPKDGTAGKEGVYQYKNNNSMTVRRNEKHSVRFMHCTTCKTRYIVRELKTIVDERYHNRISRNWTLGHTTSRK